MDNKFYALTTFSPSYLANGQKERRVRTVAIYQNKESAVETIEKNRGDLNEAGYYNWAIIEEYEYGLYPEVDHDSSLLYKFDREKEIWIKTELSDPDFDIDYDHIICIGEIG